MPSASELLNACSPIPGSSEPVCLYSQHSSEAEHGERDEEDDGRPAGVDERRTRRR